jgi:hypothetical protein
LLVVDNLETPWDRYPRDVEELLAPLTRVPGVALVASIRGGAVPARPVWRRRLEAHRLVHPHDRDLLLAVAGDVPPEGPLLPDVLRALDGWPLAIELFGAQAGGLGALDLTWRRWQSERTAMLDRGETDPDRLTSLAVSLGFSLDSPRLRLAPPHPADAAVRLYRMAGRLPDGLAVADADALLPGAGSVAMHCLVRARLAYTDGGRIRMLAPVREHAAGLALTPTDLTALLTHYLGLAAELGRYFDGDRRGIELPRLRAELVNIDALIARAAATAGAAAALQRELGSLSLGIGDARRELGQLALALAPYERSQGAQHLTAAVAVDADGDDDGDRDDTAAAAHLQVGGVDPDVGPVAFDRPLEEGLHLVVDLLAQPADLALGDAARPHRLDQLVDRASRCPGCRPPGSLPSAPSRPCGSRKLGK